MRLENTEQMNKVVRHISSLMSNSSFQPFKYASKHNTRVLSGEEEAVFAWIAVNYLRGVFNVNRNKSDLNRFIELNETEIKYWFEVFIIH